MHTHMHTYTCTHVCTHTNTHTHTHTHTYKHNSIYVHNNCIRVLTLQCNEIAKSFLTLAKEN